MRKGGRAKKQEESNREKSITALKMLKCKKKSF